MCGQDVASKPVRIVTGGVGSGTDFASRLIASGLSLATGQQTLVDNRDNLIAAEIVSKAPPDGLVLLLYGSNFWVESLIRKTPYDTFRDFAPITLVASAPNILVVHASLPAKTVKEVIALARARPGELNYGSAGVGATTHLAAELFKAIGRVDIVRIPYAGNGPALTALMGGEVQLAFPTAGSVMSQIKSRRLRALAVTTLQPSSLVPGLPTVAASGLPGYESGSIYGMFAPTKTPAPTIIRLNQEIGRYLNTPEAKARFLASGVEVTASSPDQFSEAIRSEITKWAKVIKDAGIKAD